MLFRYLNILPLLLTNNTLIEQKMSQLGTFNREAYLRKMALDGYVVKLDLPELKELVSLMRY
ncbi:MAG: hypothetical protein HFG52_05655, partial [Lachnospiraceae bacterium]|nr:hypothetical protein [Lachnospiraceae bacterium]